MLPYFIDIWPAPYAPAAIYPQEAIVVVQSFPWERVCLQRRYSVTDMYACLLRICYVTANVISLFVSRPLPSKGSTRYNTFRWVQIRIYRRRKIDWSGRFIFCVIWNRYFPVLFTCIHDLESRVIWYSISYGQNFTKNNLLCGILFENKLWVSLQSDSSVGITDYRMQGEEGFRIIIKGPTATVVQTVRMDFIYCTIKTENWKSIRISGFNLVHSLDLWLYVPNLSHNTIYSRNAHFYLNKHSAQPEVIKLIDYVERNSPN